MQYYRDLADYNEQSRSVITLGKFDGLHLGHQKLVKCIKELREEETKSIVFSFDMKKFLREKNVKFQQIMVNDERAYRLNNEVDFLVECPFTSQIRNMRAKEFIDKILVEKFHAKYVVVGEDYRFGFNQEGDVSFLKKYGEVYDYKVIVFPKEKYEGRIISSSYIKEEIEAGNMELVAKLLGYPYRISGNYHVLEEGVLEVLPSIDKLLPPNGEYKCTFYVGNIRKESVVKISENGILLKPSKGLEVLERERTSIHIDFLTKI